MLGVRDAYQNDAGTYHHECRAMPDGCFGHSVDGTECAKQPSRGCVMQGWYVSASLITALVIDAKHSVVKSDLLNFFVIRIYVYFTPDIPADCARLIRLPIW